MTSPLRTKRPITRRARITWIRTAASLLLAWLLAPVLAPGAARAQQAPPQLPRVVGTPGPIHQGTPGPIHQFEAGAPIARPGENVSPAPSGTATAVYVTGQDNRSQIQRTAQVFSRPRDGADDTLSFTIATELPGPDRMFRRQSEEEFFERIRQEYRGKAGTGRVIFPENPPLTREPFQRRVFPRMVQSVEPAYVCHGRLFFEQPNFERQGWHLGFIQPLVNLGVFYYDVALLPYHAATRPFQGTDCSAGKCLPGDRTPLYLYHEEFSVTGLVGQAGVVTGLYYMFP
jgi:hypothetical protein